MKMHAPLLFHRALPYAWVKPLTFNIGVICANWTTMCREFSL